jgi:hypothetical protein
MKKLPVVMFFLLVSSSAWAFDFNPDRFPSLGITLEGGTSTDGTTTITATGFSASQDVKRNFGALVIDARLPVSENWTFNGGILFESSKSTSDETTFLAGSEFKLTTFAVSIGARYYFH